MLKNGAATAVTAAPYVSGQAITVDGMTVAVSGAPANGDSFDLAPSTPTLSVFDTLDRAIAGLNTTGRTASQVAQANADSLRDIDAVLTNLGAARAAAGQVLNRIDSESARLDTQKLASTTERIERRRCGHGARDLRLSEQAKRLRCGAQVVRDGAAPVAVPVRERQLTARLRAASGSS